MLEKKFIYYCANNDVERIKGYIKAGFNINAIDILGKNGLQMAAYCGNIEVVKILLDAGIDINYTCNENQTALHLAVINPDHATIITLLIEYGIDVDIVNINNKTALDVAIAFNGTKNIEALKNSNFIKLRKKLDDDNDDILKNSNIF